MISEEIHECHDHVLVYLSLMPSSLWLPSSQANPVGCCTAGSWIVWRCWDTDLSLGLWHLSIECGLSTWACSIANSPPKMLCIFWKYWNFPQIPASFFGFRWCFLNLKWWNHECWSTLGSSCCFFKCCLAPFCSAMDTNKTSASQSNTGMFCSTLPRLKHVVLVYSMRIRKGTQGHEALGLKKPDLPGFFFYVLYRNKTLAFTVFQFMLVPLFFTSKLLRLQPFQHDPTRNIEW